MKQLEKKDLKIGDIFIAGRNYNFINKEGTRFSIHQSKMSKQASFDNTSSFFSYENLRHATPEEKHWLEVCIAANSFISYDEAMKTFVQYYKIIENRITNNYNNNVIYKRNIVFGHYEGNHRIIKSIEIGKHCNDSTINVLYGEIGELKVCFDIRALQPSTKEAYDAQFVVKEQLEESKDKVLEKEGVDLNIGKIIRVESSEGAIYQLDDKITVFTKNSPNKSKVFTIKGFRWNNAKTNICAITELHGKYGIGLDKIELYSEPVVKIVEDFKLPKTWKLKVCDKSLNTLISWRKSLNLSLIINIKDIEDYQYITEQGYGIGYKSTPLQSIRPEITFEQFEQYVLHNGFKVGDKFTKQKYCEVTEKEIIALEYIGNCSIAVYKYTSSNHTSPQCRILTKNIVR